MAGARSDSVAPIVANAPVGARGRAEEVAVGAVGPAADRARRCVRTRKVTRARDARTWFARPRAIARTRRGNFCVTARRASRVYRFLLAERAVGALAVVATRGRDETLTVRGWRSRSDIGAEAVRLTRHGGRACLAIALARSVAANPTCAVEAQALLIGRTDLTVLQGKADVALTGVALAVAIQLAKLPRGALVV